MNRQKATYEIKDGVHCAQFIAGDQHIHFDFSEADVDKVVQKMLPALAAGAVPAPDVNGFLHADWDGQSLVFHPRAAAILSGQRNERAYLLSLTLHRDYLEWAANFIPLKANIMERSPMVVGLDIPLAYLEVRTPPPGSGPEAQVSIEELKNITEAVDKHDAFIILGEPGCGKTTTLQKIAYDHAVICLKECSGQVPLFVRLSQQHNDPPLEFLEKVWSQRIGTSFTDALSAGRLLLLLDGVNELPRDDQLTQRLNDWRLFAEEYGGKNKIIFSGREKDYKGHLDLPRVLVRPLDQERITAYLRRNGAEDLLKVLEKTSPDERRRMQDLLENPLHLNMLAHYYREKQAGIDNRGELFEWFATALIGREKSRHPENDPQDIPVEVRREILARLAYAWQDQKLGTVIPIQSANELLPSSIQHKGRTYTVNSEEMIQFARGARILDPNLDEDLRFQHQMLHEYFAALELLRHFHAGENLSHLWRACRTVDEMPPASVGEWDPLPEPPASGWEVTTILACGLVRDPAKLIEAVRLQNPALAGHCLDEAGLPPLPLSGGEPDVKVRVRHDLLADLYNPEIHLRARLQAGFILGRIGDPRFQPQEVNGIKAILPQMLPIPAGKYKIGSEAKDTDAYDDEKPSQTVELPTFSIGKWPVTNAEFACFIEAGGYKDEQYWHTDLAKRWLKGEDVAGGQLKAWLDVWKYLTTNPGWKEQFEQSGNYSPQQIENFEYVASLSEDELKAQLSKQLSQKSRTQPAYWDDPQYNNFSQPVVGLTWFEAGAYCAWLSVITGREYRLPNEIEWEAAARGLPSPGRRGAGGEVRAYPWGSEWDLAKANSIEGRVLKPSPVGAYAAAGAKGPFEAEDQSGNVWNWTSSLYLPYPYDPAKSELSEAEGERVVRGGSWVFTRRVCRCACRGRYVPDFFNNNIGFRLVSPGSDVSPERSGGDIAES